MSLRQEIETWVAALAAYDNNEYETSLSCFEQIADTSKILFNCGVIFATLGEHRKAVTCYQRSVQMDQYLAVAYFQQGVSNFLLGDFEEALANFNDTLLYLRGNNSIDYEQLGLKFKLYSCEVLFNRGLCYIYLQQKEVGMQDLAYATREKMVADHDVIDEAIREHADGYTVFSIPVGVVYRPNAAKVKNLKSKDYLGKARLVAQQQEPYNIDPRRQAALAASAMDRSGDQSSYAALNLVRPDLRSRTSRQQSEPPLQRNAFPPTPPPEPERERERSEFQHTRRQSAESTMSERSTLQRPGTKPLRLELGAAAFDHRSQQAQRQSQQSQQGLSPADDTAQPQADLARLRLGSKRSESERPPALRRQLSNSSTGSNNSRRREPLARSSFRSVPETTIEEDSAAPYSHQANDSRQQQQHPPQQQQPQQPLKLPFHSSRVSANHLGAMPIEEEDEDEFEITLPTPASASTGGIASPPFSFEIVSPRNYSRDRARSHSRGAYQAPPPPPPPPAPPKSPAVLRKIRIKVHAEDMRYVLTTPETPFPELMEQIRVKFGYPAPSAAAAYATFKLKIKDEEGDLVTMADQDDWDMAVSACRATAAQLGSEMGKMELWVQEM